MKPRQGLVEIFSTFLQLESDRSMGWLTNQRLRRSMMACLQEASQNQADDVWARYWHRLWEQQSHPLAAAHLTAYLQETCYWVARKMALGFADRSAMADFFQVAIARVPNLLKHFNARYSQSFKGYAELVFKNSLKDWLRVQQQVEVCTDWALLYRLSRKRLLAALQGAALNPSTIEQYILAWDCFRELVGVDDSRMNALKCPDEQTWQAIAATYNAERLPNSPAVSPAVLEQWLLKCAKTVREFLHPNVLSADAPKLGQSGGSILDTVSDDPKHAPLERLITQEEELTRQTQLVQLSAVLSHALAALTAEERHLLWTYYKQEWTQTQIAKQFGLEQYQVSRQLGRIRRSLLKQLAQWSQEALHISPTPDVVDAMSLALEEWLSQAMKHESEDVQG
ncbi:MAG: sigma-70 family RNA polymerase sigma factor [Leptolyngbya sp. BL-A-14]